MNTVFNFEAGRKQKNAEVFTLEFSHNTNINGVGAHRNGNIYFSTPTSIYIQTGGVGSFVQTSDVSRNYQDFAMAPNGDVYCPVQNGDIYKQTGGTGLFTATGAGTRAWSTCTVTPSGDIYAGVFGGLIYKQTGGTGAWVAQGPATNRSWAGMTVTPNGDVYAIENLGTLYKQTGGVGDFTAISGILARDYYRMCYLNGNLYVAIPETYNGNRGIYVRRNNTGDFTLINPSTSLNVGMCSSFNGAIYSGRNNSGIYKSPKIA